VRPRSIAVVGGIALVAVSAASASREPALPAGGLAVQTSSAVRLVGLDGRLRRTLPGYRFRAVGVNRLGQVELRSPDGRAYELRGGRLVRVPADTTMLPFGFALRFERQRWVLVRRGEIVRQFRGSTHVELDDTGTVLTSLRVSSNGTALGASVALDLRTGARQRLPRTCRVGAQRQGVRFELCGKPWDRRRAGTIVRVVGGARQQLAGPAERGPYGPHGSWQSVSVSPDGKKLLAQWSGDCEIPAAYLIDVATGRRTAVGRTAAGSVPEGVTIGWSGESALVSLPLAGCGGAADRPGVFAVEGGRMRLIYALPRDRQVDVRLWD